MTITPQQLEILRGALTRPWDIDPWRDDSDLLEKLTLRFDEKTRTVTIEWWDFDDQDFRDLQA